MKRRKRHPKKEVEKALRFAEAHGWIVRQKKSGHAWGAMRCGSHSADECVRSIWSTPTNTGDYADYIHRKVTRCPHRKN